MTAQINVYGVFDLFHERHINFLKKTASYGSLVVGINNK
jgi:glycerol-3-phosphate cytidylyltransferase-like family protein